MTRRVYEVIIRDGKVLATKNYDRIEWSLPGGRRKRPEPKPQTGVRETYEETGMDVVWSDFYKRVDGKDFYLAVAYGTPEPDNEVEKAQFVGRRTRVKKRNALKTIWADLVNDGLVH